MLLENIKSNFMQDYFTDYHPMSTNVYYLPNGGSVFIDNYNCTHNFVIENNGSKIKESCNMSVEYRGYVIDSLKEAEEYKLLSSYCKNALVCAKHDLEVAKNREADNVIDQQAIYDHIAVLEDQIDYMSAVCGVEKEQEIGD